MSTAPHPLPDSETLTDRALRQLRNLILTGELAPGERVAEAAMAERLSISRTPMREAIRVLASEGLLTVNPNRGAEVTDIDEKTLRD